MSVVNVKYSGISFVRCPKSPNNGDSTQEEKKTKRGKKKGGRMGGREGWREEGILPMPLKLLECHILWSFPWSTPHT